MFLRYEYINGVKFAVYYNPVTDRMWYEEVK